MELVSLALGDSNHYRLRVDSFQYGSSIFYLALQLLSGSGVHCSLIEVKRAVDSLVHGGRVRLLHALVAL